MTVVGDGYVEGAGVAVHTMYRGIVADDEGPSVF